MNIRIVVVIRRTVEANSVPNLSMRIVRLRSRGGVWRIDQFMNMDGVFAHMVSASMRESIVGSHMSRVKVRGARIIAQNLWLFWRHRPMF